MIRVKACLPLILVTSVLMIIVGVIAAYFNAVIFIVFVSAAACQIIISVIVKLTYICKFIFEHCHAASTQAHSGPSCIDQFFPFIDTEEKRTHSACLFISQRIPTDDEFLPLIAFELDPISVSCPAVYRIDFFPTISSNSA